MGKYIATRLHQAIELAPEEEFFRHCAALPHYVIDPSLSRLLLRGDVQASINAMVEADIAHLPFEEMLLEIEHGGKTRSFVRLYEYRGRFRAEVGMLHFEGAAEVDPAPYELTLGDQMINVDEPTKRSHESWMRVSALALSIALLMLNIQGVEKEVIEPTRLNKHRVASGKPAVPRHTVMRIGHVYDSDGKRHNLNGSGRTMPVHMRAGHARRQHYGEGNELTKTVYIPPVLVNFRPGEAAPRAPKRVLAA